MKPIDIIEVQQKLQTMVNKEVFLHLETTNGAYATHNDEKFFSAGAFIRNAQITYTLAKITGDGPFRVGLQMPIGWVYAEGLTHFEVDEKDRLLMAGLDYDGKLAVALQISQTPFDK